MEEAERLCTRIGIMDMGKLIAEGTRSELVAGLDQKVRIEVGLERNEGLDRAVSVVTGFDGVHSATVVDDRLHVFADEGAHRLPALLTTLLNAGLVAASVKVVEPNLEDVFLRLMRWSATS